MTIVQKYTAVTEKCLITPINNCITLHIMLCCMHNRKQGHIPWQYYLPFVSKRIPNIINCNLKKD